MTLSQSCDNRDASRAAGATLLGDHPDCPSGSFPRRWRVADSGPRRPTTRLAPVPRRRFRRPAHTSGESMSERTRTRRFVALSAAVAAAWAGIRQAGAATLDWDITPGTVSAGDSVV